MSAADVKLRRRRRGRSRDSDFEERVKQERLKLAVINATKLVRKRDGLLDVSNIKGSNGRFLRNVAPHDSQLWDFLRPELRLAAALHVRSGWLTAYRTPGNSYDFSFAEHLFRLRRMSSQGTEQLGMAMLWARIFRHI